MLKAKQILSLLFIFLLVTIASLGIVRLYKNQRQAQYVVIPQTAAASPTPLNKVLEPKVFNQVTPDGTVNLTLKEQPGTDLTKYSFFVTEEENPIERLIYSLNRNSKTKLALPFNSWSPDNQYVFWKEVSDTGTDYYVLLVPEEGSEVVEPVNISELFMQKYIDEYKIDDVTGWAAPGLLIVNTFRENGEHGPSFWFEVYSQGFIQLSTGFY